MIDLDPTSHIITEAFRLNTETPVVTFNPRMLKLFLVDTNFILQSV